MMAATSAQAAHGYMPREYLDYAHTNQTQGTVPVDHQGAHWGTPDVHMGAHYYSTPPMTSHPNFSPYDSVMAGGQDSPMAIGGVMDSTLIDPCTGKAFLLILISLVAHL